MWRADGRELYFAAQKQLMVADIDTNAGFNVSNVRKLFPIPSMRSGWHQYDVTRDGSRFLTIVPEAQATPPSITVVLNWPSLLKHK